jgi:predicted heme/steroid binding protein/uncharacterized membrane protein
MKEMDLDELSKCNGKNGNPAWVVYRNRVIDVSNSKQWQGGLHMRRHHAGTDLSEAIRSAPHGPEVLERYAQVGTLKKRGGEERPLPGFLSRLLSRYPILRRHPHPMTVHFPIVFMLSAAIFTLLYLVTRIKSFETTAFHCLGGGILFTVVAISTGWYTWWLNYESKPIRAVTIKKRLSLILLVAGIITFVWQVMAPDVLNPFDIASLVFLLIVLSFIPLVSLIGWLGTSLTFPIERE